MYDPNQTYTYNTNIYKLRYRYAYIKQLKYSLKRFDTFICVAPVIQRFILQCFTNRDYKTKHAKNQF